jgi:hypothetical protein
VERSFTGSLIGWNHCLFVRYKREIRTMIALESYPEDVEENGCQPENQERATILESCKCSTSWLA